MKTSFRLPTLIALFACGLLTLASGCQSTSKKLAAVNPLKSWNEEDTSTGVPDRVVSTWTEAVLHQDGQSTRGFGGRLFFYERRSDKPIRVAGQLVVYAFAEDDRSPTDNRPTKRYVFPPQQLAKHESKDKDSSEIGVSYSVWLPWDAAGGAQSEVSLIARFEPLQGGGLVVSEQARQRLPGVPRQETMLAKDPTPSKVERTAFNASTTNQTTTADFQQPLPATKPGVSATTIALPGRFAAPSSIGQGAKALLPSSAPVSTPARTGTSASPVTLPSVTKPANTIPANAAIAPSSLGQPGMMSSVAGTQVHVEPAPFESTSGGASVRMLTPGESVRQSLQPRSFGSSQ